MSSTTPKARGGASAWGCVAPAGTGGAGGMKCFLGVKPKKGERRENTHQIKIFFSLSRLLSMYPSFYSTGILQQLLKLHKDED